MNPNAGPQTPNPTRLSIMDLPKPGFSRHQHPTPYRQLPPIRPLEERNPPPVQGCYWPNGASVSSIDSSRPWLSASANTQPLPLFGGLKPPAATMTSTIPVRQTPVRQTPVGAVAPQNDMWLSEFPPSLVDRLKQVTQSTGRDPQLRDFINPQSDLECLFCRKVCARVVVFNKYLQERCSAV